MAEVLSISLKNHFPKQAKTELLRAELAQSDRLTPFRDHHTFAVILYAYRGKEHRGIRIDLDKRRFLDHFSKRSKREEFFTQIAPDVCNYLSIQLSSHIKHHQDPH